jgi:hypothetical protein
MAFRHVISHHRLYHGRFLNVQKADYEFSGPFAYLKHHIRNFVKVAFLDAQGAENDFARPFVTLKHRFVNFTKVVL